MTMSRDINPFGLRMPAELREHLRESARQNHRSMNAELLLRLKESLELYPIALPEMREARTETDSLTRNQRRLLMVWSALDRPGQVALLNLVAALARQGEA